MVFREGRTGITADIRPELEEVLKFDAGDGITASMGIINGKPVIRSLELSNNYSMHDAVFTAKASLIKEKEGTCHICKKAEEILNARRR